MINQRGTEYSRRRTTLDAEVDKSYWDTSLTDQWVDIKANIETIKAFVGYDEVYYTGYSGATTQMFYALS